MTPDLFEHGEFTLHSGRRSTFRIDCSVLSDNDLAALALVVAARFRYRDVRGVPRGGLRFADALVRWTIPDCTLPCLVVDDVWTTGSSMRQERGSVTDIGIVIFARGPVDDWVHPLFTSWEAEGG